MHIATPLRPPLVLSLWVFVIVVLIKEIVRNLPACLLPVIRRNKAKMPAISGKYQHYKNENIDEYFSAVGVPYMGRKMMAMSSPLMEITLDGDDVTIKNSSLMRTVELKFKFGEEYEEKMPNSTIKSVTTKISDNEFETKSVIPETGAKCGRQYVFTDEECVVTLTHEKAANPAKRYFRRVQ